MNPSYIIVNQSPSTCTITMNRDNKKNAFCSAMSNAVIIAMEEAVSAKCRVIVLRSNVTASVWSSGHDLTEIKHPADLFHDPMFELFDRLLQSPIPVICAVDGDVYAGGFLINLFSDIVVATKRSRFCMTINRMGIPLPSYYYRFAVEVLGIHKAKEMFFTAHLLTAEDAYTNGIVNHLVEDNAAMQETVDKLAQEIASCSPEGIAYTRFVMNTLTRQHFIEEKVDQEITQRFHALLKDPSLMERVTQLLNKIRSC